VEQPPEPRSHSLTCTVPTNQLQSNRHKYSYTFRHWWQNDNGCCSGGFFGGWSGGAGVVTAQGQEFAFLKSGIWRSVFIHASNPPQEAVNIRYWGRKI